MKLIRKFPLFTCLSAALIFAGISAPSDAAALANACMTKPSALPKTKCICFEHELQKVLSPDEMRIEILVFRGQYSKYRKKIKTMNASKAKSFMSRVAGVVHGTVCNR